MHFVILMDLFFFFKQKTAYEMRISDWSSDVCSSDLNQHAALWDTLGAWAERARDVDGWHRQVIAAGVTGPEAALPYQRGIMAHIAATTAGARHLAGAAEPPAAEWLAMLRSEEHTSELQSLMRISYAVFCLQQTRAH